MNNAIIVTLTESPIDNKWFASTDCRHANRAIIPISILYQWQ